LLHLGEHSLIRLYSQVLFLFLSLTGWVDLTACLGKLRHLAFSSRDRLKKFAARKHAKIAAGVWRGEMGSAMISGANGTGGSVRKTDGRP
jgi:hypothetical protein